MYEKKKFQYKFVKPYTKVTQEGVMLDDAIVTYIDVPYVATIYKNAQYTTQKHRGIHINLWFVRFRFDWVKKLKKNKWELREKYKLWDI